MLLLGLALATALWSGVQAINAEARASYAQAAATLGQDRLSRIAAEGPVPQETYVACAGQAGASRRWSKGGCASTSGGACA